MGMLKLRAAALSALLGLACEEEQGRADEVRLYYFEGLDTHPHETIDEAEEILGMDLIVSDTPRRSVVVFYIEGELPPEGSDLDGENANVDFCGRALWAEDYARTLAHEIGHTLRLEHSNDSNNLMYPSRSAGTALTEKQIDTMRWAAWELEQCSK